MGDLLFAIANLSRKLGVEPEAALRRATEKFTTRFETMEAAVRATERPLGGLTLEEWEGLWAKAKNS
jgi:ATP diphosphatase